MAKKDYLVHIDLNQNQLLNAALQNLATAPSTTNLTVGYVYWNTSDDTPYAWTGTAWLDLGQVYTHPTFAGTGQPGTALTGANIISRITLDNGHVTGVTTRALTPADIGAATASHTHAFSQITGLPANTILANNTGATAAAKAITVADLLVMLSIAYGNAALITTGTDTAQRTWSAKDLTDWINAKLGDYLTVVNLSLGTRTTTTVPINNSAGTNVTLPAATTSLAGVMTSADKTKLDGIATGANNYVHPTDNPGAHPFATAITSGLLVLSQMVVNGQGHVTTIAGRNLTAADLAAVMINNAINNGTTSTWSSSKIYTEIQNAIGEAQTGALTYKGEYNPVTNTPAITTAGLNVKTGWTYVVSVAGTFAGQEVEPGDMIIAKVDNPLTTAANWQLVNKNIPAIVAASTTVAGIVRLATNAETITGTSNTIAVTPAGLTAVLNSTLGSYSANFGDGSTTSFTITHGLNSQDVLVQVQRISDRAIVEVEAKAASSTTVTIALNIAPANNAYRVIIWRI